MAANKFNFGVLMRSLLTTHTCHGFQLQRSIIRSSSTSTYFLAVSVCTNCGTIESEDAIVFYFLPDNATALYFHTTKD